MVLVKVNVGVKVWVKVRVGVGVTVRVEVNVNVRVGVVVKVDVPPGQLAPNIWTWSIWRLYAPAAVLAHWNNVTWLPEKVIVPPYL